MCVRPDGLPGDYLGAIPPAQSMYDPLLGGLPGDARRILTESGRVGFSKSPPREFTKVSLVSGVIPSLFSFFEMCIWRDLLNTRPQAYATEYITQQAKHMFSSTPRDNS